MNNIYVRHLKIIFFLLIFLSLFQTISIAQTTTVSGIIRDNKGVTVPFAGITFPGSQIVSKSDIQGKYKISTTEKFTQIKFSYVGYKTVIKPIIPGKDQIINVVLEEDATMLTEVVIKSKTKGYKNKDNPAVELIREVIDHKNGNRAESYDYLQYHQYERIGFSLNNLPAQITDKKLFQKYDFLIEHPDSAQSTGKSILPVYMSEKISENYYRKDPEKHVQIITGKKEVDFSDYIDQDGMNMYLNRMYADVDIYANNIFIVSNEFLSPVAKSAPTFYKYFISDTVLTADNQKLVELSFVPRNPTDILFEGKLFVTTDGNYAISKVELGLNKDVNVNWVRQLHVDQDFEKQADGRYQVSKTKLMVDYGLLKTKGPGVYGERTVVLSNYVVNKAAPDLQYEGTDVQTLPDAGNQNNKTWATMRPDTLSAADSKVYSNIDSLKKMPSFKHAMGALLVLSTGFKTFKNVDIGPVGSFYSFNPIEGLRLGLGGRTTPEFNKRLYLASYGAYGFMDQKWKYSLSTTFAFNNKSVYTFPEHYIRASYQNDSRIPGQETHDDSFLTSFKHGDNDKWLYNKTSRIDYLHEFNNHFSYGLGLKNWIQRPAGALSFVTTGNVTVPDLTTTELSATMRWAPHEKIFQGKIYRTNIPTKYPIISSTITAGVKGLLDGGYNYQKATVSLFKTFYMSQLGFTNVTLEGSYINGQAPYPLLTIHQGNQSYSYRDDTYNLMNFLEFVSDHYVSANIEHSFNGFFLNKVPLLRKAKLLEYAGIKVLAGGLRTENTPELNTSLYKFTTDSSGQPLTYSLNRTPYIEGNLGVGNILKIFRVDFVKRFNYLDHPGISKGGFRLGMQFDF
jgi:hypothetical protein